MRFRFPRFALTICFEGVDDNVITTSPGIHGLMATPSGKRATPDTVATTALVPVLITDTELEILLET